MRPIAIAAILGIAVVPVVTADADASVSIKTKTATYSISGKDGNALLDAMDRRGPKHGFLTRAIAQTSYTITWDDRLEGERRRLPRRQCRRNAVDHLHLSRR